MMEIWKSIDGYDGIYEVSSNGRVRSIDRIDCKGKRQQGRVLKHKVASQTGYPSLALCKNGKPKKVNIHSLVAVAFIGDKAKGKVCDHINGNREDNRVENLEYVTQRENVVRGRVRNENNMLGASRKNDSTLWSMHKCIGNVKYHISGYETEMEAHEAYLRCETAADIAMERDIVKNRNLGNICENCKSWTVVPTIAGRMTLEYCMRGNTKDFCDKGRCDEFALAAGKGGE